MPAKIIVFGIEVLFAASPVRADPKVQKARLSGAEASCRIVEKAARASDL
jgi:hypothetical protein